MTNRNVDMGRAAAVVGAAALQVAAGAVGGPGLVGEPVGEVANAYPTLLLPGGGAFAIWSLIYVLFAALAVRQAFPSQRHRTVHRRTGWWLAAAGLLNAAWIALFTQRLVGAAQVVIVALLACLVVAALRLRREPAEDWADRLLLHLPVAIYTGWVAVATVAGAATTSAFLGAAPSAPVAVAAVLLTGAAAAFAALRLPAVLGFAAAVCWALGWIAVATPDTAVRVAALVAVGVVVVGAVVRRGRALG
ncbi:tryptophan-rich sensory protein [Actinophytocola xanthii]|uniref:Tryptophan-rich sensory protein n=1 Tax=Actinophytocola xanthii TaxID=1912961 RepID=A0A1Q8CNG0_9PSEU|nr:tryptophan-rich sensory protein [Actinophytocola xanthii]OLF15876.1 tryptophan-rich sensory protein [Actinophytocola xanthii]